MKLSELITKLQALQPRMSRDPEVKLYVPNNSCSDDCWSSGQCLFDIESIEATSGRVDINSVEQDL